MFGDGKDLPTVRAAEAQSSRQGVRRHKAGEESFLVSLPR